MKICVLGCGLRTPLLLHGLIHSGIGVTEIALYDKDPDRSRLMTRIGEQLSNAAGPRVTQSPAIEEAVRDSAFVISSIRVGNMATRAQDERLALECGFAGQETTGPGGFAMALRTIPVALEQARIVEEVAPKAWIVNFTNPAGIITQAVSTYTQARVIGICDTPAELFFRIAEVLGEPPDDVVCDYLGLNHLGWVHAVRVRGRNVIDRLLEDDERLRRLYPTELFPPALIRALRAVPTEYLFYYYNQTLARENQLRAGVTRGEELKILNEKVERDLQEYLDDANGSRALEEYRRYLNRRNASYMKLDGAGHSAFDEPDPDWDPFEGATGYHRIAVSAIRALTSSTPHKVVLNVRNRGAIDNLEANDIVEVPCQVDQGGPEPLPAGVLPEGCRGLPASVKSYERLTIEAAVQGRWDLAILALTINPIVGNWDAAKRFLARLMETDEGYFLHFSHRDILRSVTG